MITVITSLNPNIKRFDALGNEFGTDYQRRCLNSWLDAGARLVSVNPEEEIDHLSQLNYNADFVPIKAKSFMPGSRPMPGISDAIDVAKQFRSSVVFIANSDIIF